MCRGRAGHCHAASPRLLGSPHSHPLLQMRKLQRGVNTLGSHEGRGPERGSQLLGAGAQLACPGPGHCEGRQRPLGSALALQEFSALPHFGQKCPSPAGSLPPAPGSYVADDCLPCLRGGCTQICRSRPGTDVAALRARGGLPTCCGCGPGPLPAPGWPATWRVVAGGQPLDPTVRARLWLSLRSLSGAFPTLHPELTSAQGPGHYGCLPKPLFAPQVAPRAGVLLCRRGASGHVPSRAWHV